MNAETPQAPPPPGSDGIPLVGETLSFASNPFRFIDERLARHGLAFRSNVLGRKTVVFAGPDAAGQFIDDRVIMREGSMPPHVQELFGGRSLPLLDGEVHKGRKLVVLQAFTREALAAYLPTIQSTIERYFESWVAATDVRWLSEMKRLAIEVICRTVIGMVRCMVRTSWRPSSKRCARQRFALATTSAGMVTTDRHAPKPTPCTCRSPRR